MLQRSFHIIGAVTLAGFLMLPYVHADEVDFPLTRITDKVRVIYGPFDLPNRSNRGFRNNVVIVSTNQGVVVD